MKLALDIGGSLAKLIIFVPNDLSALFEDTARDFRSDPAVITDLTIENTLTLGGSIYFARFETKAVDKCLDFIARYRLNLLTDEGYASAVLNGEPAPDDDVKGVICATGGGAFKFEDDINTRAGCTLERCDEMKSLITGLNFVTRALPRECWVYFPRFNETEPRRAIPADDKLFPYLLVNIGSGVSIIRVDDNDQFRRVDGSSMGGGSFYGLCRLLTSATGFDEILELADRGDNKNVDMLVRDIYGSGYDKVGLTPDTIAASLGKAGRDADEADIANSILKLVCLNIAQIAFLNAERHNIRSIYIGGHFIRNHHIAMATISAGIEYWSVGQMHARFLRHEGFLGALGSLVVPADKSPRGMHRSMSSTTFVRPFPPYLAGVDLLQAPDD